MRFVKIADRQHVNLFSVSDIVISDDGKLIHFFYPFTVDNGEQYHITADPEYAPDLIKALRNQVYPFSDNRG